MKYIFLKLILIWFNLITLLHLWNDYNSILIILSFIVHSCYTLYYSCLELTGLSSLFLSSATRQRGWKIHNYILYIHQYDILQGTTLVRVSLATLTYIIHQQ